MKEGINDVCAMQRAGGQRRNCGGLKKLVSLWPKREELLRNGYRDDRDTYDRDWTY